MSTRSFIGMVDEESHSYKAVLCQYDGFPDHHYPILSQYYNTTEKVRELIEMGNIRMLSETLDDSVFYQRDLQEYHDPRKHGFMEFASYDELNTKARESFSDYFYYWDGDKWFYH